MKIITVLLVLFLNACSFPVAAEYSVTGFISGLYFNTSANNFNANNTTSGQFDVDSGLLLALETPLHTSVRWFITSDNVVDYAFLELPSRKYRTNYGLRLGRVNRLSGLFSGNGVAYDKMNFLPNGTSPERLSRTLFRFDGAQVYYDRSFTAFGFNSNFTVDFSYGNPVIEDNGGLFDPAFYTVFPVSDTNIGVNKPLWIVSTRYQAGDFELFADYMYVDLRINSTLFGQPVATDHLPTKTVKAGFAYAFGRHELGFEYFMDVGTVPEGGGLGGQAYGYTLLGRSLITPNWFTYYGYTAFNPDFTNSVIASVGKTAPEYIDYGRGTFLGVTHDFKTTGFSTTAELQRNVGASFLSSTYQDVSKINKYWYVGSVSLTYRF